MPGRPRTMYRKVKAILDEVESLRAKLHALMPQQYRVDGFLFINMFPWAIDTDRDLPYSDRGKVWRAAVREMYLARNEVAILATHLNPNPPPPVEDDDLDDLDGEDGEHSEPEANDAAQAIPDDDNGQQEPAEPTAEVPPGLAAGELAPSYVVSAAAVSSRGRVRA